MRTTMIALIPFLPPSAPSPQDDMARIAREEGGNSGAAGRLNNVLMQVRYCAASVRGADWAAAEDWAGEGR